MNRHAALSITDVPDSLHDGLRLYLDAHIQPGSFLLAVLRNDLAGAVKAADDDCQRALAAIVMWLYWNAPAACWGSPAAVTTWLTDRPKETR